MMLDTRENTKEGSCRTARWYKRCNNNILNRLCARLSRARVLVRGTVRPTSGQSDGEPSDSAVSLGVRQPKNRNGLL
jgi:hypothetical protein